ncbi:MAG: aldo/keto reductase [Chloroflexota bacterium]|nr:aldo/keto reductase [Chloroflexota bacterium]
MISALGFGGAPIGFADSRRAVDFVPVLEHALDLGITFFDTAADYRRSEELLGQALRGRRDRVILATKCGRSQTLHGAEWAVREDWSAAGVIATVQTSLRQLGTDYLDLVQLHSPPAWVLDDGAALRGLQRLQAGGLVRHIGISADDAVAAQAVALGVFATLQISYSLLQQEAGAALLPAAAAQGMGLIIKQPIANAIPLLAERPAHPDWAGKWDVAQRLDWAVLAPDGDRLGLALRWVLANPLVSTAIIGTSHAAHLDANRRAALAPPLPPAIVQQVATQYAAARQQIAQEAGS